MTRNATGHSNSQRLNLQYLLKFWKLLLIEKMELCQPEHFVRNDILHISQQW